jgi:hypothetical protein
MGDVVSIPFVLALVLVPDDIGLPYLTGIDNAGLSSHNNHGCFSALLRQVCSSLRTF